MFKQRDIHDRISVGIIDPGDIEPAEYFVYLSLA